MFNPKERLEQIRRNKTTKEEVTNYIADTPAPPLFHPAPPETPDLSSRISRLENALQELTSELSSSKQVIASLKRENSELQTKLLKLQHENSQLKETKSITKQAKSDREKEWHSGGKKTSDEKPRSSAKKEIEEQNCSAENEAVARSETPSEAEPVMPQVEDALEQIRKEPIQNILKRKEQNFRALKTDPRQVNAGNKMLKELAGICKDYNKTLKKPVLLLKLQASDFE